MIAKIIGIIWIIVGFLGVIRPESLKIRLQRRLSKRVRRIVLLFLLVLGFMLAGSIFKTKNFATLFAGIVGAIIVIKVILLITNKSSERFFDWMKGRSVNFFRIWAVLMFLFGIAFLIG